MIIFVLTFVSRVTNFEIIWITHKLQGKSNHWQVSILLSTQHSLSMVRVVKREFMEWKLITKQLNRNIFFLSILVLTILMITCLQGVSCWRVQSKSALRGRRINDFIDLWCLVASGGSYICVSSTSFQKNYIGWPQQPPTERVSDISEKLAFWWSFPFLENWLMKHKCTNLLKPLGTMNQ